MCVAAEATRLRYVHVVVVDGLCEGTALHFALCSTCDSCGRYQSKQSRLVYMNQSRACKACFPGYESPVPTDRILFPITIASQRERENGNSLTHAAGLIMYSKSTALLNRNK